MTDGQLQPLECHRNVEEPWGPEFEGRNDGRFGVCCGSSRTGSPLKENQQKEGGGSDRPSPLTQDRQDLPSKSDSGRQEDQCPDNRCHYRSHGKTPERRLQEPCTKICRKTHARNEP